MVLLAVILFEAAGAEKNNQSSTENWNIGINLVVETV